MYIKNCIKDKRNDTKYTVKTKINHIQNEKCSQTISCKHENFFQKQTDENVQVNKRASGFIVKQEKEIKEKLYIAYNK